MARKIFKITGGTSENLASVSLQTRELGYDTTNKILYTGASDDGTKLGTNNISISSSILFVNVLPTSDNIRSDKFYYLTEDQEGYYGNILYYYYDGKWAQIKNSDPTSILNDYYASQNTTYSSIKIESLVQEYAASYKGSYSSISEMYTETTQGSSSLRPDQNDIAVVRSIEADDESDIGLHTIYTRNLENKEINLADHIGESAMFIYEEGETSDKSCWYYAYSIVTSKITGDNATIVTDSSTANTITISLNNVIDLGTWE